MGERGFFDLRKQFVFYASYHHQPVNVFIHLVCIWNLRECPCPSSWSLVIIKINLFFPPVWSGMCLMHFTPQIAASPDILNKVVSLWQHYKSPWLSTLPGSSGGRDPHQPDPGGDRHLRRDLCPDGPRGRVPGGRPGPAPPPLHIWSVSWHDDTNNKWLSHKYVPQILPQPMPLFRAILSGKLSLLLMWSCGLFRWNKILIF